MIKLIFVLPESGVTAPFGFSYREYRDQLGYTQSNIIEILGG